jgi:hypothetical protein
MTEQKGGRKQKTSGRRQAFMSGKLDQVINILKPRIPVREGTQLYEGFKALRSCDGKTYREFRSLAGGAKGSSSRRFSPSTVWRIAEAEGFAILEGVSPSATPPSTSKQHARESALSHTQRERQLTQTVQDPIASQDASLNSKRELILAQDVSLDKPGIYAWEIEGKGVYVGKYTHKSRPLREYEKNVRRLLAGEPYRPQKPHGFRRVHHALAEAVVAGRQIILHILENCDAEDLDARERYLIDELASGGLNGRSLSG